MIHLSRKLFHAVGVVIPVIYLWTGWERWIVAAVLGAIFLALLILDWVRHRFPAFETHFQGAFRILLDPKDSRGLNGSTLYFGGCALTVALFAREPAAAGLFALSLGDPAAAVVGGSIPSPRRGRVSLAGTLACFAVSAAACWTILPLPRALLAGGVAAAVEAVAGSKLDNFAIPVSVALALTLL
jgi:dolichol kinase